MPHVVTTLATLVVLAFVGRRLVQGLRRTFSTSGRSLARRVVGGIRWRHVWPVPLVLTGVVSAAWALMLVPGLDWGWWTALGGDGNPVFGSSTTTVGTVWEWLVPLVFMCMLLPALPLFAWSEEQIFRVGAEEWGHGRRAWKLLQFGLAHALIGIPIGAALALSIGGAYFMRCYLRTFARTGSRSEAALESTRAHTAYNGCIVVVVFVTLVLLATA